MVPQLISTPSSYRFDRDVRDRSRSLGLKDVWVMTLELRKVFQPISSEDLSRELLA